MESNRLMELRARLKELENELRNPYLAGRKIGGGWWLPRVHARIERDIERVRKEIDKLT